MYLSAVVFYNVLFHSDTQFKFHLMFVGREWQGMFVEAREKVVKSINLAKCIRRDIETWPIFDELQESWTSLKVMNLE